MSWKLASGQATWSCNSGSFELTLDAPDLGARVTPAPSSRDSKEIWGALQGQVISSPGQVEEAYVRGRDLIVHYSEHPETRLTTSLTWRALTISDLPDQIRARCQEEPLFMELVVATRTSTLGAQPVVEVISSWPVDSRLAPESVDAPTETVWSHEHPLALLSSSATGGPAALASVDRSSSSALSRFTWIHPSDGYCRWQAASDSNSAAPRGSVFQPLNLPLLEKGVIRSARVRWLRIGLALEPRDFELIANTCLDAQLPIST